MKPPSLVQPHSHLYEATVQEVAYQLYAAEVIVTSEQHGVPRPSEDDLGRTFLGLEPWRRDMYRQMARVAGEVFREYTEARQRCGRRQ